MDQVLEYLKNSAEKEPGIKKLILFGSRSRQDQNPRSDYDIAILTDPMFTFDQWSKWALAVREGAPTLCGLDLVLLNNDLSQELRDDISKEGQIFYERK